MLSALRNPSLNTNLDTRSQESPAFSWPYLDRGSEPAMSLSGVSSHGYRERMLRPGCAPHHNSAKTQKSSNMSKNPSPRIEIHESRADMGGAAARRFQQLVTQRLAAKPVCRVIFG